MKKILTKSLVFAVAVFLSVLFVVPAMIYADPGDLESITVTPEYIGIGALGQSAQYTATAHYEGGTPADEDVTATAVWTIANLTIASNDGGGAYTATAEGDTWVFATFDAVTGGAGLNVWKPGMDVSAGPPGENTNFNLWAYGCNGLSWNLDVTGTTTYSSSGTIPSDDWNSQFNVTLSEGDYTAVFSVGGVVQDTQTFSVYGYESSLDVSVGYAGETTTFTLNATNSSGKTADFESYKEISPGNWEMIYHENNIPIGNDDWSYVITQTLEQGHYGGNYWLDNFANWGGSYDFYVVNRGVPQPPVVPVVAKAAPEEERGPSGPAVNEKPISDYAKTNSGFVNLFYNRLLSRAPEKAGLDAWVAGLTSGALTGADLVNQFIFGKECQSIISKYTNEQFITFLYKTLFNRAPDSGGLNAWLARMSAGMTKEGVVNGFTHSLEFELICKNFGIKPYLGYTGTGK